MELVENWKPKQHPDWDEEQDEDVRDTSPVGEISHQEGTKN